MCLSAGVTGNYIAAGNGWELALGVEQGSAAYLLGTSSQSISGPQPADDAFSDEIRPCRIGEPRKSAEDVGGHYFRIRHGWLTSLIGCPTRCAVRRFG